MKKYLASFLTALALFSLPATAAGSPEHHQNQHRAAQAAVNAPAGTIIGRSFGSVETFAGIPYAQPPVGPLRLKPPQRLNASVGNFDARGIASSCPQFVLSFESRNILLNVVGSFLTLPVFQPITGQEDCLTVTVQPPSGTLADAKLPVLFWIFGGGFEFGSTVSYNGASFVRDGSQTGQPFIFVGVNYRLGGFGFLPGDEILQDGSANLGLLNQRMDLKWIADNIASGANPRAVYDTVVQAAGCAGSPDTLDCLRSVSYGTFLRAATSLPSILSYEALALAYVPRPDGVVFRDSPDILARNGRYAAVPMIIGNQEDEGTLFVLFKPGILTTSQLVGYLSELYFHNASRVQLTTLVDTYDRRSSAGSPFRTGIFNEISPGFKWRAAILGDLVFTLARRSFLAVAKAKYPAVPAWSYLNSYNYGTPIIGTFHTSDILQYLNFLYNLDPNVGIGGYAQWPEWSQSQQLLWFLNDRTEYLTDDFRNDSYEFIYSNI
ncbi:sterol esterase precursor [Colletotrichum incanum]|uniref:Sterol esterase n=1 Tax=Colletotrichum incanum TaxID=1573173 RepID=A0A166ZNS1_COLIC|nr:sterol esterase precursor [Colletotrichum incanum]OHX00363.1 sterol esterase precursor [Colletotrichum incanum]